MKIAIGIAHAAFAPGRRETLARLLAQLDDGERRLGAERPLVKVFSSDVRERARDWAPRLWAWAAELDAEAYAVVLLNDDVEVPERFVEVLETMLEQAWPDGPAGAPISLHVQGPEARKAAENGHPFARIYSYTGPGVVLSPTHARELLEFSSAHPELWSTQNEDGVANVWAWSKQAPFLATLPALVKHDVGVPSTLGYDGHAMRSSAVPWTDAKLFGRSPLTEAETWRIDPRVELPHVPNPWMPEAAMASMLRLATDETRKGKRRIVIGTVTRGNPAPEYAETMMRLVATGYADKEANWEIGHRFHRGDSIVHARSSIVRDFLETDATHLFLVDDDQSFRPVVLAGMLASGHDFVLAPYPRREGIDFGKVIQYAGQAPAEAFAYRYNVTQLGHPGPTTLDVDETSCAEVQALGLGCALLKREALEKMVKHYDARLGYRDMQNGGRRTVALFQLEFVNIVETGGIASEGRANLARLLEAASEIPIRGLGECVRAGHEGILEADIREAVAEIEAWRSGILPKVSLERQLWGEDTSFCRRWRAIGGRVMLYLGPGSPIDHHGRHTYKGCLEAFGLTRSAPAGES